MNLLFDWTSINYLIEVDHKKGKFDERFKLINSQLEAHKIIVKTGVIIDASVIDTATFKVGVTVFSV
ncbi:MAG TPA: hypothetical protein EYG85_10905 [Crocinitomix sp.]|nr:hypothetical protein [Crocinitomix sp.]